jgi:hypothetical protein
MAYHEVNSGKHIDDIVIRTSCNQHTAPKGWPCFEVRYDDGKGTIGPAVCGIRIKAAGFNGIINPNSLSRSYSKQKLTN